MRVRSVIFGLVAICLLTAAALTQQAAPSVDKVSDDLDRHYNDLKSLRAQFTETYRGAGITRSESGTLWLRRPGKMRWEYTAPREKLFVSDGKTAYFYVPGERQARKAPIEKLDDLRSPLRYLLGKTKLKKEFENLTVRAGEAPGIQLVRGVPKGMADRVSEMTLEVNAKGQIQRILLEETDGSQTEFVFSAIQENLPVEDSRFRFQPPAGVELIESASVSP
jgi:outer membrane lipoprotein carrier protein